MDVEHDAGCRRCGLPVNFSPKPIPGEICVVTELPCCDFCNDGTLARYDFKTKHGPWAFGCSSHYLRHRLYDELGLGKAQLWVTHG